MAEAETITVFHCEVFIAYDRMGHYEVGTTAKEARQRLKEHGEGYPITVERFLPTVGMADEATGKFVPRLIAS
jgi:hypothetical protein